MFARATLISLVLGGCAREPLGLRETPKGPGPHVIVDWDALPLPELPFPNDLAMRVDKGSPTSLRLNISTEAPTELEQRTRRKLNEASGFGIYAPITVSFDAPLDLAEIISRHDIDGNAKDDAFFVIDVTPGSPTYLQATELDVGHGRFPQDVAETDVYFPNDPQVDVPSIMFDTHDEDVNGNGKLDWGEDLDNDGWMDVPNVYPVGGDPREDLLPWYERLTNTLIFRPVVPLQEETTYAVILTERLIGEDGNPVRSPWKYVNHTRQTDALEPAIKTLEDLKMGVDDIAYAWSFTTGRITGDLVDIRLGLDGEGPFDFLKKDYPVGVTSAVITNRMVTAPDNYNLPLETLVGVLVLSDQVDGEGQEVMEVGYSYGRALVGGTFEGPNLLADRDDGGLDEVDEWWQVDSIAGTLNAEPQEITFTCAIPKETETRKQPFPVASFGHGYGSSRVDGFLFGWAFVRLGFAVCTIDFPGHGPTLDDDEREDLVDLLGGLGLVEFLEHLEDARYVDTNNDGVRDSGSHQWTADAFHTRDMVRQAVVDWMWMFGAFRDCGEGEMEMDGEQVVSCDWDGDGVPDIGGPDNDYVLAGGSLGGINNAVAAPVMPEISAHVPIVAGGGLIDISTRAPTGGAVEAMHGKLMSPLILGRAEEDGSLRITQYVNSYMDMEELHIATLSEIPAGGRVRVKNLHNGEVREGYIPADGLFRVGVPADAADYFERRELTGMPEDGVPQEGEIYTATDNIEIGDALQIRIFDADDVLITEIDTFEDEDAFFQGVTYPQGSTLVAASSGLGRVRGAPHTRRLMQVVAMATEPGDPIAYAPHFFNQPFKKLGGKPVNALLIPTVGDMVVSVNSEIALARAAGIIDRKTIDDRYGVTADQWLIDTQVVRGLEEFGPYTVAGGEPGLFDPDDLDNGMDDYEAASDAPYRAELKTKSGLSGMRIVYANPNGSHGFGAPDPTLAFDINVFAINQIARYMQTLGQEIEDDPCMESETCDWFPPAVTP